MSKKKEFLSETIKKLENFNFQILEIRNFLDFEADSFPIHKNTVFESITADQQVKVVKACETLSSELEAFEMLLKNYRT